MPVTLRPWKPAGRIPGRIYVNGLPGVPSDTKVYLVSSRSGIKVEFQGNPGPYDEQSVLQTIEAQVPCGLESWDVLFAYVSSQPPPRRGPRSGSTAAAARWLHPVDPPSAADFEQIETDMGANPIPSPTTLMVDHREPLEIVTRLRTVRNLEVVVAELPIGDYVVDKTIVIERKTTIDFVRSVIDDDKRLFHQAGAMTTSGMQPFVIIEGDPYAQESMSIKNIDGAISYLVAIRRIPVFYTRTIAHTAAVIAKLVRHVGFGLGYPDPALSHGAAPQDPAVAGKFMLTCVPGVSATIAGRLIDRFGSVAAVCHASEKELREVTGVGPTVARSVRKTLGTVTD